MKPSLQGVWAFARSGEQAEDDYLHIFEDGRMVQINRQPSLATRRIVLCLRGYAEGEGTFRIKTRQDTLGYVVGIRLADGHLEMKYPDKTLTGRPVDMRELPAWYSDELAKATWEKGNT